MINFIFHAIFVFSVIFIWLMLLYQFLLAIGGFLLKRRIQRQPIIDVNRDNLPGISILIPARNEELVIKQTIQRMTELDYPPDKLQIIIINDGSTDKTAPIVTKLTAHHPNLLLLNVPKDRAGRGKSAALNFGLKHTKYEILAVYDADNIPHKNALLHLALNLVQNPNLAAVTGKFRAYNKHHNLLTRFINIESIAFQWIIQAGRWFFLKISLLPGTNFIIRKSVINEVGGWDEEALTEDTELTFRIYKKGYRIGFVPDSVTEEQEPQSLSTWVRQRTRWARGNNYIISTYTRKIFERPFRLISLELINLLYLYYLFIFAILFSDLIFVLSLFNIINISFIGPYTELWGLAFLLFLLEIIIALHFEKEDSFTNILISALAYFTYTKLWIFIVLKGLFHDFIQKKDRTWAKTERFDPPEF